MRQLAKLLPLLIPGIWAGCGKSVELNGLTCGPGTIEKAGQCVPSGGDGAGASAGAQDEGGAPASAGGAGSGQTSAGSVTLGGSSSPIGGLGGQGGEGGDHEIGAGAGGATCGDSVEADDANCGACGYACVGGRSCVKGRCTPAWVQISAVDAPTPRTQHAAGFLGGRYVVLGGAPTPTGVATNSTAAYDPKLDCWETLPRLKTARCGHEAVSTGDSILTFGGLEDCSLSYTNGPGLERYTQDNGWETVTAAGEPTHRFAFAATWTGDRLFVFGGSGVFFGYASDGAMFDPSGPTWSDASCLLQSCTRGGNFSVFWDHNVVRVWGSGQNNADPGLAYHPDSEIWAGWGYPPGSGDNLSRRFIDDGQRLLYLKKMDLVTIYDKDSQKWTQDDSEMPLGFCVDAAVAWSGKELIAWSGYCDGLASSVGARYQPPAPAP